MKFLVCGVESIVQVKLSGLGVAAIKDVGAFASWSILLKRSFIQNRTSASEIQEASLSKFHSTLKLITHLVRITTCQYSKTLDIDNCIKAHHLDILSSKQLHVSRITCKNQHLCISKAKRATAQAKPNFHNKFELPFMHRES